MSLINDALKRAKDSQKEPATGTTHFMTVAAGPRGMSWGLIIGAALLFAAGCFFYRTGDGQTGSCRASGKHGGGDPRQTSRIACRARGRQSAGCPRTRAGG